MYTNLKLRLKADGKLYAIVGRRAYDGGYLITPMEEVIDHGLTPRPWLEYYSRNSWSVSENEVESFLAYST